MPRYNHVSVAIPMMAESENIARILYMFNRQTVQNFDLYCCVNNEEDCAPNIYQDNQETLHHLQDNHEVRLHVIDKSTEGNGWIGKKKGVGWARKILFSTILEEHDENELIVSLDADTAIPDNYLEKVLITMNLHPESNALCMPYYHPISGDEQLDRPMLRYECYMRHYLINLLLIESPYAFTALGSAMVFPAWAYKRVGGITPLQGGEDFYLMQKFAKTGKIERKIDIWVEPQGRISHRVPFGTGPAIGKGIQSMDETYPFYSKEGFMSIKETYSMLPALYERDADTPMTKFLQQQLATDDLWGPLRKNFKSQDLFVRACHERIDGLRILQYLKSYHYVEESSLDFETEDIEKLQEYRNRLFSREMELR